jgi:hypothetical protein
MSYQLNKTDGTILVDLIDGKIDSNSTNLTLVGRGYRGYGEVFNENFIKLLENFSNTAAPSNPLTGQLWWDTSNEKLKLYTGTQWKSTGEPFVQATQPEDLTEGDFWFDNRNDQLYFFDGTGDPLLIGPGYTTSQGKSGLFVENIRSTTGSNVAVIKLFIANSEVGLFSNSEFIPTLQDQVAQLVTDNNPNGIIFQGFNVYEKENFQFIGVAESTSKIKTSDGSFLTADQFLRSDQDSLTLGSIDIRNTQGLQFSTPDNAFVNMRPQGNDFFIENSLTASDLRLRVRSGANQGQIVDAIRVDASEGRIGIFNVGRLPQYTLDLEGDMRITGNLTVEGEQLSVEVTSLQVLDKSIKLAVTAEGLAGDDTIADGGGIELRSNQGDKTMVWRQATNSWTFNKNIDILEEDGELTIAGVTKIAGESLQNITFADDLVRVGTLVSLNVDNLNMDGNTFTSTTVLNINSQSEINISAGGDINLVQQRKIRNLLPPELNTDAANKIYVDSSFLTAPLTLTFDVTGLDTDAQYLTTLAGYIQDLFPAETRNIGKVANIHTYSYSSVFINIEGAKNVTTVAVDAGGTQNQPVVRDIAFSNIQFASPNRQLLEYEIEDYFDVNTGLTNPTWIHQQTTQY